MTHIERMQIELKELKEKINKLEVFLNDEILEPRYTDDIQREDIARQLEYMAGYANVLYRRIKYDCGK